MNDSCLSFLGEILLFVGGFFLVLFVGWLLCGAPVYHYEYVDTNNNTGIANSCWADRGAAFCRSGDMTMQVKSYTRIKEN